MLYLELNGRQLLLPANTRATVEHVNPLFADGLEDSFSLPMELPAEGNEEALKHVHQLPLAERTIEFDNARLGHDGQALFPGKLHVLSTTERSVRATFSIEAFVSRLRGVTLPQTLQDEFIDLLDELLNQSISFSLRPNYVDGGKCQFPMFLAPDLYGDSNPGWNDKAQDYEATQSYEINQEIRFTRNDGYERTEVWQCIDPTTPGQTPLTHPLKWNKAQYGVANAWDRASNQHHLNTLSGNFYCLVPWFYLKWILKKALAYVGYTPVGEFMDDERTHEQSLPNLTTIDQLNSADSDYYFRAAQTDPAPFVPADGWQQFRVPGDNDSTLPNQDSDNRWDPTDRTFTLDTAGDWRFQITVEVNVRRPSTQRPRLIFYLMNAAGTPLASYVYFLPRDSNRITGYLNYTFSAPDVGQEFHFVVVQRPNGSAAPTWPLVETDAYLNSEVRGWLVLEAPTVSIPDDTITVARHVPDVTLLSFLQAVGDAYNLRLIPDEGSKTLRMDYRDTVVREVYSTLVEASARQVGSIEIDHQRAVKGIKLAWDIDTNNEDEDKLVNAAEYISILDLPPAFTSGQLAVLKSTRTLLKSAFRNGEYVWTEAGYHVPDVVIGEADGAKEITPECKPVHMTLITKDDKEYLVPVIEGRGTSAWFHNEGDRSTIYLCEFKKQKSSDGTVINVPGARSWGYGWNEEDISGTTLEWDRDDDIFQGMYQACYKHWANMLVNAEPVTMSLLVDGPWMRGREWQRMLHIHGQNYLMERVPVEYGGHNTPLVARDGYLYRLRPGTLQTSEEVVPVFVCEGEGYASIVVGAGGASIAVVTSSGYSTVRNAATGVLSTVMDGSNHELAEGSYCLWSSTAEGVLDGVLGIIEDWGPGLLEARLQGLTGLAFLSSYSPMEVLVVPETPTLEYIYTVASVFDELLFTGLTGLVDIYIVYSATATDADLSDCTSLSVVNLNGAGLANVSAPPGNTLVNVSIQGAALTATSVDAMINACNSAVFGSCYLNLGTSASRTAASDTNYADCVSAGWVFLLN
jgi:hypothetical protein